jgi:hypothetical protein
MIFLVLLTLLPETCLITSSSLMAASQLWILRKTLKTCARHGTLNIQCKHYLSRSNIVLTSQKLVELQLVQRRNYHMLTPRSSSQGNLTVLVADGMRKLEQTKPGTISKFILQLHIFSTGKFKGRLLGHKDM